MSDRPESHFVEHTACAACGSSDANSLYSDGHQHCFSCQAYVPPTGEVRTRRERPPMSGDFIQGEFRALPKRGISVETCKRYGYMIGEDRNGEMVQIAPYRDRATGMEVVAQHVRYADKRFPWIGDKKAAGLFGAHLFREGGKRLVITEGELDCMTVSQAFGNSWPVVSILSGAQGAYADLQASLEWLETYAEVVLWFDADAPGQEAAQRCASLFTPGRAKIVRMPT